MAELGKGRAARTRKVAGSRWRAVALVAAVFGLPLLLMLMFLAASHFAQGPPFDDQPGGTLEGRVHDEASAPLAGIDVAVYLLPRQGGPRFHARTASDSDGRFRIDVPPLDGCYVVHAGGGTLQEVTREVSLVGDKPPDLDIELAPGSEVELVLARRDRRPVEGGGYSLRHRAFGFLGLALLTPPLGGRFSGDRFVRGGLAPGRWTLTVELDDGTAAEFELELEPGRQEVRLEPI